MIVTLICSDSDRKENPAGRARGCATCALPYLRAAFSRLHSAQSGRLPVPGRLFSFSMLLPVLHSVLLWCLFDFAECHGAFFGMLDLPCSKPTARLSVGGFISIARRTRAGQQAILMKK